MEDVFFIEQDPMQIDEIRVRAEELLVYLRKALAPYVIISCWYQKESSLSGRLHVGTLQIDIDTSRKSTCILPMRLPGVEYAVTIEVSSDFYKFLGVPCANSDEIAKRLRDIVHKFS